MSDPEFTLNHDSLLDPDDLVTLILGGSTQNDVAAALINNERFPQDRINLGSASLEVSSGQQAIVFGSDEIGTASFDAGLEIRLSLSPDARELLDALGSGEPLAPGLELPQDDEHLYVMLSWGYLLGGEAGGGLGLGSGQVTFGVDGRRHGRYALLRRFPRDAPSRDVVEAAVTSWRLPRQVRTPDNLPPDTWLVAEVDGSFEMNLGGTFGYDFTWLRDSGIELVGEVGLRIQLGLAAAFGFNASGRYALVLRRNPEEEPQKLRLYLCRQRTKGWSFALNAGLTFQGQFEDLEEGSFDDLLRATLGIHAGQLLEDIFEWTAEDFDLDGRLSEEAIKRLHELLGSVTGIDITTGLEALGEAREEIREFLERWRNLDHAVASKLWEKIGDADAVSRIRDLATRLREMSNTPDQIEELVLETLRSLGFGSVEEEWLSSVLGGPIVPQLAGADTLERLARVAGEVLEVLDQDRFEELLGRLKSEIEEVFRLDRAVEALGTAIDQTDPERLDALLRQKIRDFFEGNPTVNRLRRLQETIRDFRARGQELYERVAPEIIEERYGLSPKSFVFCLAPQHPDLG